jgi:hypothetical protein
MKNGDLVDSRGLAAACGYCNGDTIRAHAMHPLLAGYHVMHKAKSWWGNKKTIEALKKQLKLK